MSNAELNRWTQRPLESVPHAATLEAGDAYPCEVEPAPPGREFDPIAAYLDRLGPGSRRTMREALRKLAHWASDGNCDATTLPWHELRAEHTVALRTRLASTVAPATANKHLAALRGVLKQCWRAGLMTAEDYQRAIDFPTVRGASPRQTAQLSGDDLYRLSQVCQGDTGPAGARDEALLALLYGAQLRRSEAVALDLEDYEPQKAEIVRPRHGRTLEDTDSSRRLALDADARRALERWILVRGSQPGPLFYPVNKGGRIEQRRLSEQAIYIACQKRAAEAGLPPTSPEDLRRAAARRAAPRQPQFSAAASVG